MQEGAQLRVAQDVMTREVGDETVLLHLGRGEYFGLDAVGTSIWRHLVQGVAAGDIPVRLMQEWDVSEAQARADVERLLGELEDHGLVLRG